MEVLTNFRCKKTNKVYLKGSNYEGGRKEELTKLGYLKQPENKSKNEENEEKKATTPTKKQSSGK